MSQLTQARRALAKSRRRVWRLGRTHGVRYAAPPWMDPTGYALWAVRGLPDTRPRAMVEARALEAELERRKQRYDQAVAAAQERARRRFHERVASCLHDWRETYYGTKCPRCGTFYPHGCAPWDVEPERGRIWTA